MNRVALRLTLLGLTALAIALVSRAPAAGAARVEPSRPASLPVVRVAGVEYHRLEDVARHLGLTGAWEVRDRDYRLTGSPGTRIELHAGSREIEFDGHRVFLGQALLLRSRQLHISRADYERVLVPLVRPSLAGFGPARPRVIAIDPGHGGGDPGMENERFNVKEKDLTLDVARRLKALLEADGYQVIMTRTDDRQLGENKTADFRRRTEIANTAGADLFVSIHFNSLGADTRTGGTEVFVFSRQNQRSDQSWNSGQNDAEKEASPVNRYDPWSTMLALRMQESVIGALKTSDRGLKTMHSAVLRGLQCPGVLVESMFLSNPSEAQRAASPETRQQIAQAMREGIRAYAASLAVPR